MGLCGPVWAEAAEHVRLAAPVCVGMLCNRFVAAVSVVFVGRLGPHLLAPAALATTISNVLGNSVMVGAYTPTLPPSSAATQL
jgi:Na+-driven multidrug efflux pump